MFNLGLYSAGNSFFVTFQKGWKNFKKFPPTTNLARTLLVLDLPG